MANGKPGRPSLYTSELAQEICERISNGEPLRQICRDDHMPSWTTVYGWEKAHPEFAELIASARARGEDSIAAECMEIADDARNDYMDKLNAEGEVVGQQLNSEHVQRSKLRIETRLKLLAKWNPRKYGEKLALGGADDLPPIKTISDEQLDARIASMLDATGSVSVSKNAVGDHE